MDGTTSATLSQNLVLVLAILGLVIPAVTALGVALIGKSGKSQTDPGAVLITKDQHSELLDRIADLDDSNAGKDHQIERLREDRDLWQGRAYEHGWRHDP